MRGRVNASARNTTSGCSASTSWSSHSQNGERLGVRVVDPEDPHAEPDPVPHDAQHLGADADRVVVEVDRVDVLVLLGRVLGVGDAAVRQVVNHSGCSVTHGWSGEHCRARSSATSRLFCLALPRKATKSAIGAQVGVDRVVAALGRRRSPTATRGRPGRRRACCSGPCGRRADRVDRRQVDHVEAHRATAGRRRAAVRKVPLVQLPFFRASPPRSGGRIRTSSRPRPARVPLEVRRGRSSCAGAPRVRSISSVTARSVTAASRSPGPHAPRGERLRRVGQGLVPRRALQRPGQQCRTPSQHERRRRRRRVFSSVRRAARSPTRPPRPAPGIASVPVASSSTSVCQRSVPGMVSIIRCVLRVPSGEVSTVSTPIRSWPSLNTVASKGTTSPAYAFGGHRLSGC